MRRLLVATALIVPALNASAFSVSPMVKVIAPTGNDARVSYKIDNTNGDQLISFEASAFSLSYDEQGNEVLEPADDDLLLFPPIAQVQSGSSQIIQVQYIGEPALDTSRTYRVVVEQLPVSQEEGAQAIAITSAFSTLLSVVPKGVDARLSVLSADSTNAGWELTIENSGKRFSRMTETTWVISSDGTETKLGGMTLGSALNENLVLPNSTRKMLFAPPPEVEFSENSTIRIEAR